jgi:hypothetical protein
MISPGSFPKKGILGENKKKIPATTRMIPTITSNFPMPCMIKLVGF